MSQHYLVEVTQQQSFTVAIDAESPLQAIELVNNQQGVPEGDPQSIELLTDKTRIISGD
ncbi:MAG: hypothetical protein V7629_03475 [Motiliproteus sp.]